MNDKILQGLTDEEREKIWAQRNIVVNHGQHALYPLTEDEMVYSKAPKTIIELEAERLEWSLKTFPEATASSSLQKTSR